MKVKKVVSAGVLRQKVPKVKLMGFASVKVATARGAGSVLTVMPVRQHGAAPLAQGSFAVDASRLRGDWAATGRDISAAVRKMGK